MTLSVSTLISCQHFSGHLRLTNQTTLCDIAIKMLMAMSHRVVWLICVNYHTDQPNHSV